MRAGEIVLKYRHVLVSPMAQDPSKSLAGPSMYCRKCFYALEGLDTNRCPECGRAFDPGDRRTYRRRPPWMSPGRRRALVATIVTTVYFGSYYSMARVSSQWAADRLAYAYERFEPEYRFAGPFMRILFMPAYQVDAAIRHDR